MSATPGIILFRDTKNTLTILRKIKLNHNIQKIYWKDHCGGKIEDTVDIP
jgi:hypothetical protein